MKKAILFSLSTLFLLLAFGCSQLSTEEKPNPNPATWKPIFNGNTFLGWNHIYGGKWLVEDEMIIARGLKKDKSPATLVNNRKLENYSIRLEYKVLEGNGNLCLNGEKSDSGLKGLEINWAEDELTGEWEKLEILNRSDSLKIWRNAELIEESATSDQTKGFIGLQLQEGMESEVMIRNIEIKEY